MFTSTRTPRARHGLVFGALLCLSTCLWACPAPEGDGSPAAKPTPRPPSSGPPDAEPTPTGAPEPVPESSSASPAHEPPTWAPVSAVDSAITTGGLPLHLRVALAAPSDAPMSFTLRALSLLQPEGGPLPLAVDQLQLWLADRDEPRPCTLGQPFELAPGQRGELLVYLEGWDGDRLAERYRFEARFVRDALPPESVEITIQRATRHPHPRP